MGGRGASSSISNIKFRSGQKYENDDSNIFIRSVNFESKTVRFIEGFSPSAIHDAQDMPIKSLESYMKKYGFKHTGRY